MTLEVWFYGYARRASSRLRENPVETRKLRWSTSNGTAEEHPSRMLKKAVQQGRSEVRDAKNNERHVCGRRRDGEPAVS
ncbi:MAG: hypothetical protein OJF52_000001 [Nitrospira sp.]|nr:MAG: hypothetical protein OJF52_000001 [Nitrospira sp.]